MQLIALLRKLKCSFAGRVPIVLGNPLCNTLVERIVIEMSSQLDCLAAGVILLVDRALNPGMADFYEATKPRGIATAAPDPAIVEIIASTHEAQCDVNRWICYEGKDLSLQLGRHTFVRVDHQYPGVLEGYTG